MYLNIVLDKWMSAAQSCSYISTTIRISRANEENRMIIMCCINPNSYVILFDKDALSFFFKKVLRPECVVPASATNNTLSLSDIKLDIIAVCCIEETQEDLANISQCFAFSHNHHLTIKYRLLVLTHQRLLPVRRGRQCTAMHT